MRPKRTKKLLNPNQPTESLGLIFVQQIAHAIRAIWRATPNDDYGLDGELELTRGGEVTGFIIKAQVKSGRSYFHNKTAAGFDYHVPASDANYWARVTFPVILVIYDPETNSGYWVDVKAHLKNRLESASPVTIRLSRRSALLSADSLLDFSAMAIPDEVERTDFLVDQIRETLHSNMLPVQGVPPFLYEADFSLKRLADAEDDQTAFAKTSQGKYQGFRDPLSRGQAMDAYIDSSTIRRIPYPDYLKRSSTRTYAVGRWNQALRDHLFHRGLIEKDDETFYFSPLEGSSPRKITWESMRGRTPDRHVAYPYIGKKSEAVAFWVHHACRAAFCEVAGCLFLRITPAYVFTRDGTKPLAGSEAGALSTSRKSKDRNYQVLNHLMFWLWFLADGKDTISFDIDGSEVVVTPKYCSSTAAFGIPADTKSLIEIIAADHDVDWEELETAADAATQEDE